MNRDGPSSIWFNSDRINRYVFQIDVPFPNDFKFGSSSFEVWLAGYEGPLPPTTVSVHYADGAVKLILSPPSPQVS